MLTETVTSARNDKVKRVLQLQEKARARRECGRFVVEGRRELGHCLAAGFQAETLFVCEEILPPDDCSTLCRLAAEGNPELRVIRVPAALYARIAYREGTEGILAEIRLRERSLDEVRLGAAPLVVVLEGVEKPGNLGAVLRSADAAGADAVICCDPATDWFNPNLIRASLGGVFTTQVAAASTPDTLSWLRRQGLRILTAQLQDASWYYDTPMTGGTALILGTESTGLTSAWRRAADARIKIPMLGRLDSLNVSVSAAILLFEAVRQRQGGAFPPIPSDHA